MLVAVVFSLLLPAAVATSASAMPARARPAATSTLDWRSSQSLVAGIYSLACPTPKFCLAGGSKGRVLTYDGTRWSEPTDVFGPTRIDPSPKVVSISCANATFCAATTEMGAVATFNGQTWSAAISLDSTNVVGPDKCKGACPALSVACPKATYCVAVGDVGFFSTYNGAIWSPSGTVASSNFLTDVTCASQSFCIASNQKGGIFGYNGKRWSSIGALTGSVFDGIACPSQRFCVGVTDSDAFVYRHRNWSAQGVLDKNQTAEGLVSLSCPSTVLCAASDNGGFVITYDPTTFTTLQDKQVDTVGGKISGLSVSCPSPSFCVAVDLLGNSFLGRAVKQIST